MLLVLVAKALYGFQGGLRFGGSPEMRRSLVRGSKPELFEWTDVT